MKINAEKIFLVMFVVSLSIYSAYFLNSNPDIYVHYITAKEILKDPSFLWRTNLVGWQSFVANQSNAFLSYPPLLYFFYVILMILSLPLFLVTISSIVVIGYVLYKWNGLAIPFMFLSFMFLRESAFNGYDIPMVALTLLTFYYLSKDKIILSGIFAGMTALIKPTGFFVILGWMLWIVSTIMFKRKKLNNIIILAFLIAILIPFSWYLKNYMVTKDAYLSVIGLTKEAFERGKEHISSEFQMNQPERFLWDSTGYYPLPIDILFYIGIFFFVYNLIGLFYLKVVFRSGNIFENIRMINVYSFFVIIMIFVYFFTQLSNNAFFVIRHMMLIFPFLTLEIARGMPKRFLLDAFIICVAALILFSLNLPKYSFNQFAEVIKLACVQIKERIGDAPVYVNAFHSWFVIYQCNLNATIQNESKWTLDFDKGQLYATNP